MKNKPTPTRYEFADETTGPPTEPTIDMVRSSASPPVTLPGHLGSLSLPRQVFALSIWPFLGALLNFLVSSVDTGLAGRLSVEATNAIAIAAYFGWLIGLVYMSVGTGSTALIARAIGARHRRIANAALGQSILLAAISGLAVGLAIYLTANFSATFMGLTGESHALCVTYLQIMGIAAPLSGMLFVGGAALRGAGDTKTPFYILLVVNIVNIIASVMLVYGPDPIGGWDVAGIAYGTLIAWAVGCVMTMIVLARGAGGMKLRLIRIFPRWEMLRRVIRIGLPSLVEMFLGMWLANFLILKMLAYLNDPAAWGAHVIAIRLEGISYLPGHAIGLAAGTLAGQYLGTQAPALAARAVRLAWYMAGAMMFVLGLAFIFFAEPLVRLYTNQPDLLEKTPPLLVICGYVQVFFSMSIVLSQAMRGAGDTRATMFITAFSTYAVRLPLVYFLGIHMGLGVKGVWYGLCIELVVRGCLFTARFLQGGWKYIKV